MIKAVFLDLDGTLYDTAAGRIPESAMQAIAGLHERDVRVFLASGRHMSELEGLPLDELAFDGMVLANGSVCVDGTGAMFYGELLPHETVDALVDAIRKDPFSCQFFEPTDSHLDFVDDALAQVLGLKSPLSLGDLRLIRNRDFCQAVAFASEDRMRAFADNHPEVVVTSWESECFDIVPAQAGKDRGIRETLRHFGLNNEEWLAVGDGENDCKMLLAATYGVAMGNADPRCKVAADYVTDDIAADGLLHAFIRYGLLEG